MRSIYFQLRAAATAALSVAFVAMGCGYRAGTEGLRMEVREYSDGPEYKLHSRYSGKAIEQTGCEFSIPITHDAGWLKVQIWQLGSAQEASDDARTCSLGAELVDRRIPEPLILELIEITSIQLTQIRSLFEFESRIELEVFLVPAGHSFDKVSRFNPESAQFRISVGAVVNYQDGRDVELSRALSAPVHELVHVIAHEDKVFHHPEEEEFYAYMVDKCYRVLSASDGSFWKPQFNQRLPRKFVQDTLADANAIEDLFDAGSGSPSVRGLSASVLMFEWALEKFMDTGSGTTELDALNTICKLVISDPAKVISDWPELNLSWQ